jgi:hypothetical protein
MGEKQLHQRGKKKKSLVTSLKLVGGELAVQP